MHLLLFVVHRMLVHDIECELKYEFREKKIGLSRDCIFYIEIDGHKQIFATASVYGDESPLDSWSFIMSKVPVRYKNDFIMLWKKAHYEEVEEFNRAAFRDVFFITLRLF